jgi:hypothetical protein
MRAFLIAALAMGLAAQQPQTPRQPGGRSQQKSPDEPSPEAGDDVRGYNDTPRLPGQKWRVHDVDRPRPLKVAPGLPLGSGAPPSDAVVLFNGKDLTQWVTLTRGRTARAPTWKVKDGYMEIVPRTGRLATKQKFGDCQLHVEWMVPKEATGSGQSCGNSGIELMTRYEIQVLESYQNLTYADGGAGAVYGVWPPLVNPARPPGEWNVYDIFFEAPRFERDKLLKRAYVTLVFNGVLVQNHRDYLGTTIWRRVPTYTPHAPEDSLSLQDHSQPVRFRNIWIRRVTPPVVQ